MATPMTQDELKQAVARAAIEYVVEGEIVGVGTGSTANFFIDELAKDRQHMYNWQRKSLVLIKNL